MKKTLSTLVVAVLIALSLCGAVFSFVQPEIRNSSSPAARPYGLVYDATGARDAAILYPEDPQLLRPVVYDATGAMLEAITPHKAGSSNFSPVYDATGAMLKAINPQKSNASSPVVPLYDATGALLDAVVYP